MTTYAVWIMLSIVVGLVCALIARAKGKDAVLWFILGACFNIVALVIIAQVEKKKREKIDAVNS